MRKSGIFLLSLVGIVLTSLMSFPVSATDDVFIGNLILNGDFSAYNQTTLLNVSLNYSNNTGAYDWIDLSTAPGNAKTWSNFTCQALGFDSECMIIYSAITSNTTGSVRTNNFTWNLGLNGTLSFYWNHPNYNSHTIANVSYINFNLINATDNSVVASVIFPFSNLTNASVRKQGIDFTSYLIDSQIYYIKANMSGYKLEAGEPAFYWDNVSLGNSSQVLFSTITRECFYNNPSDFVYPDITISCPTPFMDVSACDVVKNIRGEWYGLLNSSSYNTAFYEYVFNASLTDYIFSTTGNGSTNELFQVPYELPAQYNDYVGQNNVFGTCSFKYNASTNATLRFLDCRLSLDCGVYQNQSINCTKICINGYEYSGGVYNKNLGVCENFTSSQHCGNGYCYDVFTCEGGTSYNYTQTNYNLNTTATIAGQVLGLFNSNYGYAFVILFILEIGIYYISNEFFTLAFFTGVNFIFGYIGYFPSWVGYLLALLGLGLIGMNFEHFRGN